MMVYQVTMGYYDGDHEHGMYNSPLFADRADAETFRDTVLSLPENDPRKWWTDDGSGGEQCCPAVVELEIRTSLEDYLQSAGGYLDVSYT